MLYINILRPCACGLWMTLFYSTHLIVLISLFFHHICNQIQHWVYLYMTISGLVTLDCLLEFFGFVLLHDFMVIGDLTISAGD